MSKALVDQILNEHFKMQDSMIDLSPKILNFAQKIVKILKENGTVFWCGNGGSASDSQHLAAELVGRFEQNRPPLKSISLNTDTSIITALSNDFSYEMIFERQLDALATSKDLLIVISTSGNSKNIIRVLKKAKEKKIFSVGLLGKDGGEAKNFTDLNIIVPSKSTARIQEMHIMIGHIACSIAEKEIFKL